MEEKRNRHAALGRIIFAVYLCFLAYFLFFAESMGRTGRESTDYSYNVELFREIQRFWTYREQLGTGAVLLNLLGNVAAFLPFGMLVPLFMKRGGRFLRTMLHGLLFSLGVELIQLVTRVGSFDVDDIFLNVTGCLIGYLIYRWLISVKS